MLELVMTAEKKGKVGLLPYQNYLVRQVVTELADDIKHDSASVPTKGRTAGAYKKFALYMGSIDPKIAALRGIQAVLGALFRTGGADLPQPIYNKAAYAAGKAIYAEYLMRHFKQLNPQIFNSLQREYDKAMTRDERHLLAAFRAKYKNEGYDFPVWDFGDIESVGMYIMNRLVAHNFIESWSATERKRGKAHTVRYCRLAEHLRSASLEIMQAVSEAPRVAGALIEKPLDWDAATNGGGGYHSTDMQRLMPYAVQGPGPKPVAPAVIETLNYLQGQGWRINEQVLKAVTVWAPRRDFGDVVALDPGPFPEFVEDFTPEQKKHWKGQARQWYTDKKTRAVKHARCYKALSEARELLQYPTIWFAYYADFRGRLYTRSASVSPQGSDLEKGLLMMENGKPFDSASSERWFKIHGANKWGLDKKTLDERVQWVEENHELIIHMGSAPEYHPEWLDAESPVQFLAWAVEYAAWARHPAGFVSHLPLGQDGTCNGLQNFSALMRDEVGGRATNLLDGPTPRDIYNDVACRTTELLAAMDQAGMAGSWLRHGINRKITKRTTMTLPYGCTRFACSGFINDDYLVKEEPPEFDKKDYGQAANFLSHVVWRALDDVVVKAREVMEWLKGWAKHAAANGHAVSWVAPSGLLVRSEYDRMAKVKIKSVAFKTEIRLYKPEEGKPDLTKIANAVAPNFVHSLDASHLSRVVLRCKAEGITLVCIHDDYGTHACDTERLHRIIREEFVAMYTGLTILEDMARITGYEVSPPAPGTLDLNEVLKSTYFFA